MAIFARGLQDDCCKLHNYLVDTYIGVERYTIPHERLFVHEMGRNVLLWQSLEQTHICARRQNYKISGSFKCTSKCKFYCEAYLINFSSTHLINVKINRAFWRL